VAPVEPVAPVAPVAPVVPVVPVVVVVVVVVELSLVDALPAIADAVQTPSPTRVASVTAMAVRFM
jgi:hypothetical protein